jgi:hypothetical protein
MDDKRKFLLEFDEFLHAELHGKCYFKLTTGQQCQGWISEIYDETFEYLDSGPLAREEHYFFIIQDIDLGSFAYWDNGKQKWLDYPSGKDAI